MIPPALKLLLHIMNTLADRKKDVLAVKGKDCKEKQENLRCGTVFLFFFVNFCSEIEIGNQTSLVQKLCLKSGKGQLLINVESGALFQQMIRQIDIFLVVNGSCLF